MKKMYLILLLTLMTISGQVAHASNFKLTKGNQYELCREIKTILDEPENKDFKVKGVENSMFIIPKKYKNFTFPNWEDVPITDVHKYIAPGKKYDFIMQPKNYSLIIQKAEIDLDNNGKKDIILRKRRDSNKSFWSCYASDVTDTPLRGYNTGYHGECNLFYYKGRIFIEGYSDGSGFGILEVFFVPILNDSGSKYVCEFGPKYELKQ